MNLPQFWLLAGPNGAGKTTCAQAEPIRNVVRNVPFLNPDDETLLSLQRLGFTGFADTPEDILHREFCASADRVFTSVQSAVEKQSAIGVETVLSTTKYLPIVERVLDIGGLVGLIYVALSSPELCRDRIARRVREGGHDVPQIRVVERWNRSLENLTTFARLSTAFWVIDNSGSDLSIPPSMVAWGSRGKLEHMDVTSFPRLVEALNPLMPPQGPQPAN